MEKSYKLSAWLVAGLFYGASSIFALNAFSDDSQDASQNNQQEQTTVTKIVVDPEIAAVTEEEPDCE